MNIVKLTVTVAALAAVFGAAGASAATQGDCNKLATQVNRALKASESSPSYDAAQKQKQLGSYFCSMSSFKEGVDHYTQALALLGQK